MEDKARIREKTTDTSAIQGLLQVREVEHITLRWRRMDDPPKGTVQPRGASVKLSR